MTPAESESRRFFSGFFCRPFFELPPFPLLLLPPAAALLLLLLLLLLLPLFWYAAAAAAARSAAAAAAAAACCLLHLCHAAAACWGNPLLSSYRWKESNYGQNATLRPASKVQIFMPRAIQGGQNG